MEFSQAVKVTCLRFWALVLGLVAGCSTASVSSLVPNLDVPSAGPTTRLAVHWNSQVVMTPDVAHGGTPMPGIAGRLYFFDDQYNLKGSGDGKVVVELFDPNRADGKDIPIEIFQFDNTNLQKLFRKDGFGWGYTLFLPWGTYKPELTQIKLRLRFEPAKGVAPMYTETMAVTFNNDPAAMPVVTSRQTVVLPGGQEVPISAVKPEGK
jgi:hypothetical protein